MTDEQILYKTLFLLSRHGVELTVSGTSMLPVLRPGDTIMIRKKDSCGPGDILVFLYQNSELLVHRLLKIEAGRYFCKGDNSFRLEDVDDTQIIGAVSLPDDPHRSDEFIASSLDVARSFRRCDFDREKTMQTDVYQNDKKRYLEEIA